MLTNSDPQIKEVVPYYCDSNGVPLTVTGLWAQLGIGDGVSEFTSIPAMGTNAATYGELPWRIYITNLVERYMVLNALKYQNQTNIVATISGYGTMTTGGYCNIEYPFSWPGTYSLGAADGTSVYDFIIDNRAFYGSGGQDYIGLGIGGSPWGLPDGVFQITLDTDRGSGTEVFWVEMTVKNATITNCIASDPAGKTISFTSNSVYVAAALDRTTEAYANFGVQMDIWPTTMITNDFYYCTNAYWE
jgi:hypothetical protein